MTRSKMTDGYLLIEDEELGIAEKTLFSPLLLSEEILKLGDKQIVIEKDALGRMKQAFFFIDKKKEGECCHYYPSGKLQAKMYYKENLLHGPSNFFSEDGVLLSSSVFFHGKRHGKMMQYYLSGKICSCQRFIMGQRVGKQEYFYEDGEVKSVMTYENDRLHGQTILYFPNGRLKRDCSFIHGLKEGRDSIYDEKGRLIDQDEYRSGALIKKGM